jgi:hypothetical protein
VATGRCTLTGHKFVHMNNSVYNQHKLISLTVLRKCGIAQTLPQRLRGYIGCARPPGEVWDGWEGPASQAEHPRKQAKNQQMRVKSQR